jgi:hypothetical protein
MEKFTEDHFKQAYDKRSSRRSSVNSASGAVQSSKRQNSSDHKKLQKDILQGGNSTSITFTKDH